MTRRNLTVLILSAVVALCCYRSAPRVHYSRTIDRVLNLVESKYLFYESEFLEEDEDSRQTRRQRLLHAALAGVAETLDRNSSYLPPAKAEAFSKDMRQRFGGLGVLVRYDEDADRIRVIYPLRNTPAWRAGVRALDLVMAVDGKDTKGLKTAEATELMKGPFGEALELTVLHPGEKEPETLRLIRGDVSVPSVFGYTRRPEPVGPRKDDGTLDRSWNFFIQDHPEIGYVRIEKFGDRTVDELERVLTFVDHEIEALILDLRGNPGGALDAAVEACDLFIDEGDIVKTKDRHKRVRDRWRASPSATIFPQDIPIVVLVNGDSRAVVVGQRTFGKGTVQNVFDLRGNKGSFKLTTATYWRPSGKNIHKMPDATEADEWGVRPDPGLAIEFPEALRQVVTFHRELSLYRQQGLLGDGQFAGADASRLAGSELEGVGQAVARALVLATGHDPQLAAAVEYLREKIDDEPAGT